ncbi:transmembrane protein FAM155A-like [Polypterus senegalus]|uniref:transmembrane protein FAM155A-like n=1 Tax=Polypterus senegalus TaxID=55291 RepID=UPI0019635EE6|nr:transmembrane protein FAM155A-like [Polypterus senegalus]
MTRGAWMCRQQDDGLKIWFAPRENEKPFADSERAQKWRLSLASLLFFTVLLSDHLWFCAEAKLTRPRDKQLQDKFASANMSDHFSSSTEHLLWSALHSPPDSLSKDKNAIFIGNSTKPWWRLETCHPHSLSKNCFTFEDAESVCRSMSEDTIPTSLNLSDFYLSFCNSYSLLDLFSDLPSPDNLNCSLEVATDGNLSECSQCIQAYQLYDQHAQEKYEEFEVMIHKFLLSDGYSVNSCLEDCKTVYKLWLCSQYFEATQHHCSKRIPCKQYCLEVQTRCPFILPDNDDVVYGGMPSFLCTGLLDNPPTNAEPECCDVRWDFIADHQSKGTIKATDSVLYHHRTSLATSAASRLCNSRLKLCILVLILLHTVVTVTAAQNSTGLSLGGLSTLEDHPTNEE